MYVVDVVEALVKLGTIDLNAELHNTTSAWLEVITPLNLASIFGHYDILKVLVAAGAELRLHDVNIFLILKYFSALQTFFCSPDRCVRRGGCVGLGRAGGGEPLILYCTALNCTVLYCTVLYCR